VQQTFVCSRAGLRQDRGLTTETRKHESRNEARCECGAMCHVHIDNVSRHCWYVSQLDFDHDHELLDESYCAMIPSHRKLTKSDIMQNENFGKVGIRPPLMYAS